MDEFGHFLGSVVQESTGKTQSLIEFGFKAFQYPASKKQSNIPLKRRSVR